MSPTVEYGHIYDKWHSYEPQHVEEMKSHFARYAGHTLPEERSVPILDIGCAMGFALIWLRDLGYTAAEGIERDAELARRCRDQGLRVQQVIETADWLRARPNTFSRIYAFDLIEHIPHELQLDLCRAINDALLPDGQFICTVPNASSALAGRWRYMCWTHHDSFTEHSLDYLLHLAGFESIRVETFELMAPPRSIQGRIRCALQRLFRGIHRLEAATEVGWSEARKIPLTLNLRGIATKKNHPE